MKYLYLNKNKIKIYSILFVFIFGFIWLAELRPILSNSLNSLVRYTIALIAISFYILTTKRISYNQYIVVILFLFVSIIYIVNINTLNISLFATSFYIFPFLILLFFRNTIINNNSNIQNLLFVFHIILILYTLKIYSIIASGGMHQLNENEVASYSLVVSIFSIIFAELYSNKFGKLIYLNILTTLLIGYLLDARAIMISSLFILFLFSIRRTKIIKSFILYLSVLFAFFIPIILVVYSADISIIHEYVLIYMGQASHVINADLARYEMYFLVDSVLDNFILGKGIGNNDYISIIKISGLHSGTLDLLYWGGYPFYIIFMFVFLSIIYVSYQRSRLFLTSMLLIYWLILLNYYEGLLFGNMGLMILFIYLIMSLYNKSFIITKYKIHIAQEENKV